MNTIQHKRITKLIKALKSGKYKPNYDFRLKDEQDNYDILGIACQVSKLGHWKTDLKMFGPCYAVATNDKVTKHPIEEVCDSVMPQKVVEYYGFKDFRGTYGGNGDDDDSVMYDDLARDEKEEDGEEGGDNGDRLFEEDVKDSRGQVRKYQGYQHETAKCLKVPKFTFAPSLSQLHDTKQMDFKQLAKFIERAIKDEKVGLFK